MMFNTEPKLLSAKKPHQCTWCGEPIEVSQPYYRWVSFGDSAFTSKMHPECRNACNTEYLEWGEDEYSAFTNERPVNAKGQAMTELNDEQAETQEANQGPAAEPTAPPLNQENKNGPR